ncbi:MAG: CinA family protein [bacterium]|nr:CinA family protein [bacterium]
MDNASIGYTDQLYADIAQGLISSHSTVSVAESLTGGLIGHHLSKRPGSSRYFLGGVVCYSALLKVKLCGVKPQTISEFGVVSRETAQEMVEGIARLTGSDYAVSATGIAGPLQASESDEMLGMVYIGIKSPERVEVKRFRFKGNREHVITQTVNSALGLLRNYVKVFGST